MFAGNTEIGLKRIGTSVTVPADPRARLMYYLRCICQVLSLDDENLDRLTDFTYYYTLTTNELDALLVLCILISPDNLVGKCIFEDDELCGDLVTQFYELSAVQNRFLVTDTVLLGSQQRHIKKIMTFKKTFLQNYYIIPIATFADRLRVIAGIDNQPRASYHTTAIITQPQHLTEPPSQKCYERACLHLCITCIFPLWIVVWCCLCAWEV
ncbi:uncharacterized protein LOC133200391 [Saccostrea echinata]|uniref:uncharacterized protein LOC133200391 n=1 Tax=Saccostrea echinata TaxID=191078 RepID=UPI002A83602F|nr:uncharacterized protein LOC133200391 [Saccostrea echinata]